MPHQAAAGQRARRQRAACARTPRSSARARPPARTRGSERRSPPATGGRLRGSCGKARDSGRCCAPPNVRTRHRRRGGGAALNQRCGEGGPANVDQRAEYVKGNWLGDEQPQLIAGDPCGCVLPWSRLAPPRPCLGRTFARRSDRRTARGAIARPPPAWRTGCRGACACRPRAQPGKRRARNLVKAPAVLLRTVWPSGKATGNRFDGLVRRR